MSILVSLTFLAAFFPFLSPVPVNADIQVPFFLLAGFCLVIRLASLKLSSISIYLIGLTLWSFANLVEGGYFQQITVVRFAGALVACVFFLNFTKFEYLPILVFAIFVNVAGIWAHYLFGESFVANSISFVRAIKWVGGFNYRGVSGFAPEPGLSSAIVAGCTILYLSHIRRLSLVQIVFLCFISSALILTRSGSGVLFGTLCFIYLFLKFGLSSNFASLGYLVALSAVLAVGVNGIDLFGLGRGEIFFKTLMSPESFVYSDGSIGARVVTPLLAVYELFENPFGSGIGSYTELAEVRFWEHGLERFISPAVSLFPINNVGLYVFELGIWFVCFLVLIVIKGFGSLERAVLTGTGLLLIGSSFSFALPLAWLLVQRGIELGKQK